ncbi:hypothetical protein PG988_011161 [Apiospora saccharicola]
MSDLRGSLYRIASDIERRWKLIRRTQDPRALHSAWRESRESREPTAIMALHTFRGFSGLIQDVENLYLLMTKKASNPHDLVFACRAQFPDTFGQIVVDYQRDLSDILREVTAHIISQTYSLGGLLGLVSLCPAVPGAPSWALKLYWDGPPRTTSYFHYFGLGSLRLPYAEYHLAARVLPDGETLSLRGFVVDHVALVSDPFPTYTLPYTRRWHNDVHTLLKGWRSVCASGGLKSTFEEGLEYILYAPANSMAIDDAKMSGSVDPKGTCLKYDDNLSKVRRSALREWMNNPRTTPFYFDEGNLLSSPQSNDLMSTVRSPALSGSRLFITACGRMGLGRMVRRGDAIAIIAKCTLPIALRPVQGTGRYTLGQPSVLQGATFGEEWPVDNQTEFETIETV